MCMLLEICGLARIFITCKYGESNKLWYKLSKWLRVQLKFNQNVDILVSLLYEVQPFRQKETLTKWYLLTNVPLYLIHWHGFPWEIYLLACGPCDKSTQHALQGQYSKLVLVVQTLIWKPFSSYFISKNSLQILFKCKIYCDYIVRCSLACTYAEDILVVVVVVDDVVVVLCKPLYKKINNIVIEMLLISFTLILVFVQEGTPLSF